MLRRNLALQRFNFFALELDHVAGVHIDHVVVMAAAVQLVHGLAAFEIVLQHQASSLELGQHAVNRGQADFVAMVQQLAIDVFCAEVVLVALLFEQFRIRIRGWVTLSPTLRRSWVSIRSPFIGDLAPAA